MGFFDFDREAVTGLDKMFDLDGDGMINPGEQGMMFEFLEHDGAFFDYENNNGGNDYYE